MGNGDKLLVCDKLIELSTECSVLGGAPEGLCATSHNSRAAVSSLPRDLWDAPLGASLQPCSLACLQLKQVGIRTCEKLPFFSPPQELSVLGSP